MMCGWPNIVLRRQSAFRKWFSGLMLCSLLISSQATAQTYYYDSQQMTDQHRFQEGAVGGFWGHHLGHMVRTATRGLWYVDDTGQDVNINPSINYYRFNGTRWAFMRNLTNPSTIQQNTATIAVGDSIFTYGVNISGGYIEEAACDAVTNTAVYNRRIRFIGGNTNYIGAAVSPNGTRIVWWTRVVNNNGPSDWVYMFKSDTGWSSSIVTKIAGNDFSYVFASFLNDSTFYVGGEVPGGAPPSWTYEVGAGKVVLGQPIQGFTKMKGDNTAANSIWVNKANGDVHLLTYGSYGGFGCFYKPSGGPWTDTVALADNLLGVGRCRFIDASDGNLYLIASGGGFSMMTIPKASVTGKIDFASYSTVPLGSMTGFTASYAIWAESIEFQTTPVGGINFAYPGNDYDYANILRTTMVYPNPGTVALRVSMPNGMETYQGGQNQSIYWYRLPSAGIDTVSIEFSSDGGSTWSVAAARAPNKGSYLWPVPTVSSSTCRIRVANAVGGSPSDMSDGDFVIQYTPVTKYPPTGTITRPTKDTTVKAGTTMTFEGTGTDRDGYITNYVWHTGDGRVVKGVAKKFDHSYATEGIYYATLQVQDNDTLWSVPDTVVITVTPNTGVEAESTVPNELALYPNYPNPFNAGTVITYSLDRTMHVRLGIYSVTGEEVDWLTDGVEAAGMHRVEWQARNREGRELATGMYICRLETPQAVRIQKILLIR